MVKFLNGKRLLLEILVLLLVILLGKEWIYSLPSFTDTEVDVLGLFLWPFAVLLLVHRVIPWKWIRFSSALLFVLIWYERTLWPDVSFFSFSWVSGTFLMLKQSSSDILRMDWLQIDPILRTGLFYLLIWIGVYLIYIRVLLKRKAMGILLLSILYLSVLDTFLLFDGKWPIIKTLFYGFALLAIFNLNRVEGLINRRVTYLNLTPWFMTGLLILFAVGSFGYFVPKGEANWPDPVAFFTSLKNNSGDVEGLGVAKSGYGKDDRRLGGSFVFTEDIILVGEVNGERYPAHYWRGESKDYYSGHGWESQQTQIEPFLFLYENPHSLIDVPQYSRINEQVTYSEPSQLFLASGQPVVVTPYAFEGLEAGSDQGQVTATINPNTFMIQSSHPFLRYETISLIPKISEDDLIAITDKYGNTTKNYPQEIMNVYTQLPEELPERIGELTSRIMGSETNTYKKVKRIEYYLRWSGYQYRTTNIPYPAEGQDFVDQFLFETKRGYCDHFSSSMVVMLRTQGIPARWVKGYTFGEMESTSANTHKVTVRGKNAHSWVEVYFPEVGWIPFEPTSSFSYPFEIMYATQQVDAEPAAIITPQINELLDEERAKDQLKEREAAQAAAKSALQKWSPLIIVSIMLILGSLFAFFFREKIALQLQTLAMVNDNGSNLVYRGYRLIMRWLAKLFGIRAEHQTIREYTADLKMKDHKDDLAELTRAFEETRYGEKEPSLSKGEFMEIWKRLLNKLRS